MNEMVLPKISPIIPVLAREPFDHPEWVFELKYDGFRSLAYIEQSSIKLISKNNSPFTRFKELKQGIVNGLGVKDAILDGEIACLDSVGRPHFLNLMYQRGPVTYCAFDLLWLDGQDLRELPLLERKQKLKKLIAGAPKRAPLLYASFIEKNGIAFFEEICRQDLEGIVAKWKYGTYKADGQPRWVKIKHRDYTQAKDRWKLFQKKQA
jgi:bifunctional non-homologous end joining protein LigD